MNKNLLMLLGGAALYLWWKAEKLPGLLGTNADSTAGTQPQTQTQTPAPPAAQTPAPPATAPPAAATTPPATQSADANNTLANIELRFRAAAAQQSPPMTSATLDQFNAVLASVAPNLTPLPAPEDFFPGWNRDQFGSTPYPYAVYWQYMSAWLKSSKGLSGFGLNGLSGLRGYTRVQPTTAKYFPYGGWVQ